MSANDPEWTYGHLREARLEQPSEAALDGVILRLISELAGIRDAERDVRVEIEVEPNVDQRTVLCEWHARDDEAGAGARERKRSIGGKFAISMLPNGGDMRHHQQVRQMPRRCHSQAES
jgi:hypothetical protein